MKDKTAVLITQCHFLSAYLIKSALLLLTFLACSLTWANALPEPTVNQNRISWSAFDAKTINVHRKDGKDDTLVISLPGTSTSWIAQEPGDYYLVAAQHSDEQKTLRSSMVQVRETVAPEPSVDEVDLNRIVWPIVDAKAINVYLSDDTLVASLPGDSTSWVTDEPGDYFLVATDYGDERNWPQSAFVTIQDPTNSVWANYAPVPIVDVIDQNRVSWPVVDAKTINVHRADTTFVVSLPGSSTSWVAQEPGDYYLVATDDGDEFNWPQSHIVSIQANTESVLAYAAPTPSVNDYVISWPAVVAKAIEVHSSDNTLLASLPGNSTEWIAPAPGDYYLVASDDGDKLNWPHSTIFSVLAQSAPVPTVDQDIVTWPAVVATSINVHRDDDTLVESLPGSTTEWLAPESGIYYLVATDHRDKVSWPQSTAITVEEIIEAQISRSDLEQMSTEILADGTKRINIPDAIHDQVITNIRDTLREDDAMAMVGADSRKAGHIRTQMRSGLNIASDSVDVVALDADGLGSLYLVQATTDAVVDLDIYANDLTDAEGTTGSAELAFSVTWADDSSDTPSIDVRPPGYNAGKSSTATNRGRSGRTLYFNPAYSSRNNVDHWVTTNWEKWQSNRDSKHWFYNRYATFDPANGGVWSTSKLGYSRGEIVDATIRSRPWSSKKNRVVGGPYDYEPRPQERCSTSSTQTVSYGGASLSMDSVNCYSEMEVYPNANRHSMGAAWYGNTTSQRYLDFAYALKSNGSTPSMADYVWMSVKHCWVWDRDRDTCSFPYGSSTKNYKWTDSGYY